MLTNYGDRQLRMLHCVNEALSSLLRREAGVPALERIVLLITLNREEVGDDGIWAISPSCARRIEDTLLQLLDGGVISRVEMHFDVQYWYASDSLMVRVLGQGKDESDARLAARLYLCEQTLKARFPRLEKSGVLEVSAVPVCFGELRRCASF